MRYLPDHRDPTVAVIGLGYVGSCFAATLADRGLSVVGIDVSPRLVEEIGNGYCRFAEEGLAELLAGGQEAGRLRVTTDYSAAATADVVLICVGTPVRPDGSLADEQLSSACRMLAKALRPEQLVILKSTVPPGTVRDLVVPLLETEGLTAGADFGVAFTPERLSEGTALADLRSFPIVAGGLGAESTAAAAAFWRRALDAEVIEVPTVEAAEIVKLASNWWFDLSIALGNELAKFSALYDVDVLDVIRAANSMPVGSGSVNILLPSVGVGGSCLTKDPWMVFQSAQERGLDILTVPACRDVNDSMPAYTAGLAIDALTSLGKDPGGAKVAVLGLAFKNDTGDLRATPVKPAVDAFAESCGEITLYDPLVDRTEAEELFGRPLASSVAEAVGGADVVAVLARHKDLRDLDFGALPVAAGCVLLDGRGYYTRAEIDRLTELGYHYRGVGR